MALNIFTTCSTLSVGCILYTDSGLTTQVSDGYYSDGTNCYTVGSSIAYGRIDSISTCTTLGEIDITNVSYDIEIGSVYVGGAIATYLSGGALPNTTGTSTILNTNSVLPLPDTVQIDVYITAGVSGQSIVLTDSSGYIQCQTFPPGAHTLSFTGCYVDTLVPVTIYADPGTC